MTDLRKIDPFAERVIERFADAEGLTDEECDDLGLSPAVSHLLLETLGRNSEGLVTQDERGRLEQAGFSIQFIQTLAGTDGGRALQHRVAWLADHAVTRFWRRDNKATDRAVMIRELGEMGTVATGAIPRLIEALDDESLEVRLAAAEALGKIGPAAAGAIPRLTEVLDKWPDSAFPVVAKSLIQLGSPPVASLILALHDPRWQVRYKAAELLGTIDPARGRDAAPALLDLLLGQRIKAKENRQDGGWWTRQIIVWSLGQLGDPSSIPLLISSLDDPHPLVRQAALRALIKLGPAAIPALGETVADRNQKASVRQYACRALGHLRAGDDASVSALIETLGEPDPRLRGSARQALIQIGEPAAARLLVATQTPQSDELLAEEIFILGEIHADNPGILDTLLYLTDVAANPVIRKGAIVALTKYAEQVGPAEVRSLYLALEDPEVEEELVINALVATGPAAPAELVRGLEASSARSRAAVKEALVRLGGRLLPELARRWEGPHQAVHQEIEEIFLRIGPPAVPFLIPQLSHADPMVREHTVRLLGGMGASDAERTMIAQKILERLPLEPEGMHDTLTTVLVQLKEPAIDPLIVGLGSASETVREHSAQALGEIAAVPERVIPALGQLLEDKEPIRKAAAGSLARYGAPACPVFVEALKKPDGIRELAIDSLVLIGRAAVATAIKLVEDPKPRNQQAGQTVLVRVGRPAIQPMIRRLQERPLSPELGRRIAEILARSGPEALEPIRRALENPAVNGRRYLLLAELGARAKPAIPELLRTLGDEDPQVVLTAEQVLKQIGPATLAQLDGIAALLDHPQEKVRRRSLLALKQLAGGGPAARRGMRENREFLERLRTREAEEPEAELNKMIQETLRIITRH